MGQLRIPGPTPLPPEVLKIQSKQMINHRGGEFHSMMTDVTNKVKQVYQTGMISSSSPGPAQVVLRRRL
jgi:aspartate aminotransferase-like enzyme